jgi:hypothetical protein
LATSLPPAAPAEGSIAIDTVEPVPEYDALFERRSGWTGADAAYTVPLAEGKTLWLFGDTWIGPVVEGRHKDAVLVNNTVALQTGDDPNAASTEFFWGNQGADHPKALLEPARGSGWLWPLHGAVVQSKLCLFMSKVNRTGEQGVFAFRHVGTVIAEIGNPQDQPSDWHVRQRNVPFGRYTDRGNTFFGSAVTRDGNHLYVYGAREDWDRGFAGRRMIVARVPEGDLTSFGQWRFYSDGQWVSDFNEIGELFDGLATEYSVSYQPALKHYVVVYTHCGMSDRILLRVGPTPVGPWSTPREVFSCPEQQWDESYFCYAAKGHPELSAPDELIVTYVSNSTDFWKMAADAGIYRPRFIRISFAKTR